MKCTMAVYKTKSEESNSLQDFGQYDSIQDAKDDWERWDKPRGMHHAIIGKEDGGYIYLGKKR
jgi:hypothetical protein